MAGPPQIHRLRCSRLRLDWNSQKSALPGLKRLQVPIRGYLVSSRLGNASQSCNGLSGWMQHNSAIKAATCSKLNTTGIRVPTGMCYWSWTYKHIRQRWRRQNCVESNCSLVRARAVTHERQVRSLARCYSSSTGSQGPAQSPSQSVLGLLSCAGCAPRCWPPARGSRSE